MPRVTTFIAAGIKQLLSSWRLLLALYAPLALVFFIAGLLSRVGPRVPVYYLTNDVTDIGNLPFYAGSIAQLNLLLWAATATSIWLAYYYLKKIGFARPQIRRFLLLAGVITTVLMLDDTYLIHEVVFPHYLHISEHVVSLAYLILGIAYISFGWTEIVGGEYWLFFLALGLFLTSIVLDAIPNSYYADYFGMQRLQTMLKEGSKMAGILTWLVFYARYTYQELARLVKLEGYAEHQPG
jgi:hypothetical protein